MAALVTIAPILGMIAAAAYIYNNRNNYRF